MKRMLAVVAFALLAVPSYAMYGGETLSYQFPKCDMLDVVITNASLGEWSATPNCIEESAGTFSCGCADGWNLYLVPKVNAIGTYNITMTAYSGMASTIQTVSYNNGYVWKTCKLDNYVCTQFQSCCEGLACEDNICHPIHTMTTTTTTTIITTTTLPQTTTTIPMTTTTMLPEATPEENNLWLWSIAGVILAPIIIWYLNGLRLKHKEKQLV